MSKYRVDFCHEILLLSLHSVATNAGYCNGVLTCTDRKKVKLHLRDSLLIMFRRSAGRLQQLIGNEAILADRLTSSTHAGPSSFPHGSGTIGSVVVRLVHGSAAGAAIAIIPNLPLQPMVFGKVLGQVRPHAPSPTPIDLPGDMDPN